MNGGYKNLMSPDELNAQKTPEERKKSAKKAGVKSGAARRAKKTRKELARALANCKINDEKVKQQLLELGFEKGDLINSAIIVAAVFQSAASGDIKAVEKWEEWTEEGELETSRAEQIDAARASWREFIEEGQSNGAE